ncbi:MAG: response regulator [bacterium]|nr:response regulator [bacterium]
METKTLLIVDDSKSARAWVEAIASDFLPDWSLLTAEDGAKGLAAAEGAGHIDAAVLDYNMPVMDGFELASRLQELFPSIPIAILTANIQKSVRAKAQEAGIQFISKPIKPEKLQPFFDDLK